MSRNETHVPIAMSEIANLEAMKLLDLATFKFANELWLVKFGNDTRETFTKDRSTFVADYFLEHYSETPTVIRRQVINAIGKIGREVTDYFCYGRKEVPCRDHIEASIQYNRFCWTSQFTIDRIRTALLCYKTKYIEGYACPVWISNSWMMESPNTKLLLIEYFDKYSSIVYIYWAAYVGYHSRSIERYLTYCSTYLEDGTIEERVLQFFIMNGNIECLDYFKSRITPERHREIVLTMIKKIINGLIPHDLRMSIHVSARTVVFLWRYLDQDDRCRIVQHHFSKFYHFLLYSPGTESLISAIQWYKPLIDGTRENCRYLENTALKITSDLYEGQRYRCMFWNLYKSVRMGLSNIDIVNLLEVLLAVNDVETASMMVRMMEEDKRNELLDAIPTVWNDLWKASIGRETFFAFFFEVQSHLFRSMLRSN